MLILTMMLLVGLAAAVWGFIMCFLPVRWDRLTEKMSFARRWTEQSAKRSHPLVGFGHRVAGLAIFGVGCWFAYVAASEIYLVFTGRAVNHINSVGGTSANSTTPALVLLSVFVAVAGTLMAVFPAKAVAVFESVWPAGRSVRPSSAPKIMVFVRIAGVFFALLAIMSLVN